MSAIDAGILGPQIYVEREADREGGNKPTIRQISGDRDDVQLYRLMREYAAAGGAILFYSTEIPELVHLADRVLVLYQGRIADEIGPERLTEEAIVTAALGGAERQVA